MKSLIVILPTWFFLYTAAASAQVKDKDFLDESRREQLEKTVDINQSVLFDYGGWFRSEFISLDDKPTRDHRRLRFYDLRLWGSLELIDRIGVYARIKNQYTDYNQGESYTGDDHTSKLGHLDQGFIHADLSGLIFDPSLELEVQAGRQFFRIGRGLVYNNVHDGVLVSLKKGAFSLDLLASHTITSRDDMDQSRPEKENTQRAFGGGELTYRGLQGVRTYVFTLIQRDLNDESPDNATQNFDYDSEYFGGGVRANLVTSLTAHGEFVYETGNSVANASTERETIRAYAATLSLQYLLNFYTRPALTAEYMYGSGDEDRTSPMNTVSGNLAGTTDKGFVHFGFVPTGFSLFPKLSNISVYKFGATIKPIDNIEIFEHLDFSVLYYIYRKNQSEAGISDSRADLDDKDIGREVDVVLRWRFLSDVGIDAIYGKFFPGDAYTTDNERNFLSIGVTYSF